MRRLAPIAALVALAVSCGQGVVGPEPQLDPGSEDASVSGQAADAGVPADDAGAAATPDAGTPSDAGITPVDAGVTPSDAGTTPSDAGTTPNDGGVTPSDGGVTPASCPVGMAHVPGLPACIDRWEAALLEELPDGGLRRFSPYYNPGSLAVRAETSAGRQPQGYISGTQAAAACARAGKRLCALAEWLAACQGHEKRTYPYGNTYVHKACNEGRTPHPVVQFYGTSVGVWDSWHMNDAGINQQADTVANSGAYTTCITPEGVADLVGNVHEWIADHSFKGGYYVDAEINGHGCLYTTTAHAFDYHDYSTGFRCCSDAP